MSLVILKSEYLKLIQIHSKLIAELPKAVQFCAAKLIQYFQHWSNWKQNVHRTMWIYMPIKRIHEDLMGEHSLHVIRAAIALLVKLGILKRRHNPNGQDKTWQYQLKSDVLACLLNSEHGTFKAELGENNAEQQSQDQCIDILSTTTDESKNETTCAGNAVTQLAENEEVIEQLAESIKCQDSPKPLTQMVNKTETITDYCSDRLSICLLEAPSSASAKIPEFQNLGKLDTACDHSPPKPTPAELSEVNRQLRELRVNPNGCKGVIIQHWANVQGAISYLKSATWAKSPIAVFIDACKKGLVQPEQEQFLSSSIPSEIRPPTKEQFQDLDRAKSQKEIYDYFFSTIDAITKVVFLNGFQKPWWEFLQVSQC